MTQTAVRLLSCSDAQASGFAAQRRALAFPSSANSDDAICRKAVTKPSLFVTPVRVPKASIFVTPLDQPFLP